MADLASAFSSSTTYLPHGYCITWDPPLVWLHVVSDALIALAYYAIPITLLYFFSRRPVVGYNWLVALFAAFILACGTTHLIGIVTLWEPIYWLEGWMKAATAAISLGTALLLWPLVPKGLALPSPSELQTANENLQAEVAMRRETEQELLQLQANLEVRVQERTADLELAKTELQREVEERIRVDRFKDELVAMVSHELRTPLTSIAGSLHALRVTVSESASEREELMDIALRNTDRLIRLVDTLLDIERMETGKLSLNVSTLSMNTLARTAIQDLQAYAETYGVRLALIDDSESSELRGDPDRLTQVITNLLSNAVKHAPRDSTVEVHVSDLTDGLRVSVVDQGPGVPEAYREQVFEKFQQVRDAGGRADDGYGLGLSIARTIVSRHGGTLGLLSDSPRGTEFYMDLPFSPLQKPAPVGAISPESSAIPLAKPR